MVWGPETHSLPTPFDAATLRFGGVVLSAVYLSILATTVLLGLILFGFFRFSRIGIAMQAASQNQLAAYCMGIPVKRVLSGVWALSAAVATVAGVMLAPINLIDTNLGTVGLKAFAAAVIGGFGSIPGAVLGGILIGLIDLFWVSTCRKDLRTSPATSYCSSCLSCVRRDCSAPSDARKCNRCASYRKRGTTRTSAYSLTAGQCSGIRCCPSRWLPRRS